MKSRVYKYGNYRCEAYLKTAGHGYEVGFCFGKETVFVGNFIHHKEATKWYTKMNTEVKTFNHRYTVGKEASTTWYAKFFSHHLYKAYYSFLDHEFAKYHKTFAKAIHADAKKYNALKTRQKWDRTEVVYFRNAA
jgi:hypothetical protein